MDVRSFSSISPNLNFSRVSLDMFGLPSSTTINGLLILPLSQFIITSFVESSYLTLTSDDSSPFLLVFLMVFVSPIGSSWYPTRSPLIYTLPMLPSSFVGSLIPLAFRNSTMSRGSAPSDIFIKRAPFFTRPQFCPSGVSLGHILPH